MTKMKPIVKFMSQQEIVSRAPKSDEKKSAQLISGLGRSAKALSIAAKYFDMHSTFLVITPEIAEAYELMEELSVLIDPKDLYIFELPDVFHTQMVISSPESRAKRVEALDFLSRNKPGIVLTSVAGARKIITPPEVFIDNILLIDQDSEIDLSDLISQLILMGYARVQRVSKQGEFSVRGGIIDVYPLLEENPVRIELFGDEIDSMRTFDPVTQRSIAALDDSYIMPFNDILISLDGKKHLKKELEELRDRVIEALDQDEDSDDIAKKFDHWLTLLKAWEWSDDLLPFVGGLYSSSASIIDYLPKNSLIIYDEYARIREQNDQLESEVANWIGDRVIFQTWQKRYPFLSDYKKVSQIRAFDRIYYSLFRRGLAGLKFDEVRDIDHRPVQQYFGQLKMLEQDLKKYQQQNYRVIIMARDEKRLEEIQRIFQDFNLPVPKDASNEIKGDFLQIVPYQFSAGFELPLEKLTFLTEKELFNKAKVKKRRQQEMTNAERLKDYNELSPGDYVVHMHHGIGKYLGMHTLEIKGIHQDYLTIAYTNDDKVFVPVDQLHLVQKYVSSEGASPKLHKLGGTSWAKTKKRVSKQVEDIADELLEIYAARESQEGYAYPKPDQYYAEFEEQFPYVETPDQLKSIAEVNEDLSRSRPMDRLIIGDVGYGKTEVAMRAAFRVVQEGRQVAFLVPTTVLAQQHFNSFKERFDGFPVEIEMLSRFKTPKETAEIIEKLRKGQIDVIIGTHRLLSDDISFRDLGLLIVDEEQRFGVKHKERLKKLKTEVDILTLTATPIPRTLHMSIVGARDLSVIETPPENRYPVQTYVTPMNEIVIKDAIERELSRNGQVFYLHNRVSTIERRARDLKQLVPDARVAYAHGQMTEAQLERVLLEFIQGEYDILVTTTIIETGVDIANVNTLLIEDAHKFGLSQLYQLRGRVGRSHRIAYAYLMYDPSKVLTEESEKRLKAIEDFTELGSGFKIAMRDLAIRGAGNLLGSQQSGFIDSVGFDLYSQLLEEAVAKKQGKEKIKKTQTELSLDIDAYIPDSYIPYSQEKIEIYKRIRNLSSKEEYIDLQDELIDRFGDYPKPVADLLLIGLLKHYSDLAMIEHIEQKNSRISVLFSKITSERVPVPEFFKAMSDLPLQVDFNTGEQYELIVHLPRHCDMAELLAYFIKMIQYLAEDLQKRLTGKGHELTDDSIE